MENPELSPTGNHQAIPMAPSQAPTLEDFESLREQLESANLAAHRRAQAFHWLNAGSAALQNGNGRLAKHCHDRLLPFLQTWAKPSHAKADASSWKQWDEMFWRRGLASSLDQVTKQGHYLTPAENKAFSEQARSTLAGRASYWAIRRSITERLLRARLNALRSPLLQSQEDAFASGLPVGPYNHRKTIHAALRVLESVDTGWVRDFMRIYTEGLASIGMVSVAADSKAHPVKSDLPKGNSRRAATKPRGTNS